MNKRGQCPVCYGKIRVKDNVLESHTQAVKHGCCGWRSRPCSGSGCAPLGQGKNLMREYSSPAAPTCLSDPVDPNVVHDLTTWCRLYSKDASPSDSLVRCVIGVYQVGQMLQWARHPSGLPAAHQNAAAAVIHLLGASEMRRCGCEDIMPTRFSAYPRTYVPDVGLLCIQTFKCLQAHFYMSRGTSKIVSLDERKTRFSKGDLRDITEDVIRQLVAFVPVNQWRRAVRNEVQILLGG